MISANSHGGCGGAILYFCRKLVIFVFKGKICLYITPKMVEESANINIYFSLFIKVIIIGDVHFHGALMD